MSFNPDSVLEELDIFDSSERDDSLPQILEDYLIAVAKNGKTLFPWDKLKPLLKCKIEQVLVEFCRTCPEDSIPSLPNTATFNYDYLKNNIFKALDSFESAPFTIQRVCELITDPRKHYNRTDKYMRGLEKNLLVVSTVEPKSGEDSEQPTIKNQPAMVNGVDSLNNTDHDFENCASNDMTPVNGTVLENFATVFPSAPHLANPSNIQVSIVSGTDSYQSTENISTFTYCTDNNDEGFHDAPESTITYETNGTSYCEPESEDKYIIIEELNAQETDEATGNDYQENAAAVAVLVMDNENQCQDSSTNSVSSSEGPMDDNEVDCEEEPDRKRRKISLDNESDLGEGIALDSNQLIVMDSTDAAVPESDPAVPESDPAMPESDPAQPSTGDGSGLPVSQSTDETDIVSDEISDSADTTVSEEMELKE